MAKKPSRKTIVKNKIDILTTFLRELSKESDKVIIDTFTDKVMILTKDGWCEV